MKIQLLKHFTCLFMLLIATSKIHAQDTFLDATFGNNGKVIFDKVDATEQATCLAKQSDGKIIAAGTFITRYNLDGSVDTTFGTNGFINTFSTLGDYGEITETSFIATAITIDQFDNIFIAYNIFSDDNKFFIIKLNNNGNADLSFNFVFDTTTPDYPYRRQRLNVIKSLPSGKILCGGGVYHQMGSYTKYFKQINSDGSVDTTFNTDIYFHAGMVTDIQIQTDGKYVIVGNNPLGESYAGQSSYCGRINPDGATDVYFGNLGFIAINQYLHNEAYNCKIDSNGKIIILQRKYTEIYSPAYYSNISYLSRYNANGTIDTSFGDYGVSIKYQTIDGYSDRKVFLDNSQNIYTAFTHNNKIQIDKYDTNGQFLNSHEKGASRVSNNFADVLQTATGDLYFLSTSFSFSDYSLLKTNISFINDTSFGNNGYVNTGFETIFSYNNGHAVFDSKLQPDGKILVSGALSKNLIKRFNADGTEDIAFNTNSKHNAEITINTFANSSINLTSDDKIIVGYSRPFSYYDELNYQYITEAKIRLYKLTTDGSLDTTFGSSGILEFTVATEKFTVLVQNDNSFFVVCNTKVYKFNADGSVATTFGTYGVATYSQLAYENAILFNNNIYIGGTVNNDFALLKMLSSGSIDTSFGTNGLVTTDFSIRNDKITKLLATSDNKIIALGSSTGSNSVTAAAKYNLDGSFDTSFGILGRLLITQNVLADAVLQQNNEVVFLTFNNINSSNYYNDFLLTKLTATGQIDTTFGNTGIITTDFGFTAENAKNLLMQPNGQLIAIGSNSHILMARYGETALANESFDEVFSSIKIYPNPFIDKLYIDFDTTVTQIATYKLYDITGKEIEINKIETQQNKVALQMPQHLTTGIYFLQIRVNNKTKAIKIVK